MKTIKIKILGLLFLSLGKINYSQIPIPLYKMVMNSDIILILEANEYEIKSIQNNEYYTENIIKFKNISNILKNRYNVKLSNFTSRIEMDNNDFFLNINGEHCSGVGLILDNDKKYYNLFFLRRKENKYFVIAHLWNDISIREVSFFKKNIFEINKISKERDKQKKYQKIKDWFEIANESHLRYTIQSPFTEEFNMFFNRQ